MLNVNCEACEDIRQNDPSLIVNGFTDAECASLKNDTGLNPSSGHNDCQDLTNMNDCLIGNEDAELENYEVCDWKAFMHNFIPNLWTLESGIICAICGIWTNIHNLWNKVNEALSKINEALNKANCAINGTKSLISALNSTTQGTAFVRYFRDNSGVGSGNMYRWSVSKGSSHTLDIYMDADVDNTGSRPADRDYVVIIGNCTDIHNSANAGIEITYFSSGDARSMETIRKRQSQHPTVNYSGMTMNDFSWTTSGAVLIRKGEHVRVNAYVFAGSRGWFRIHQFVMTWIPVNIDSSLDPSKIIPC